MAEPIARENLDTVAGHGARPALRRPSSNSWTSWTSWTGWAGWRRVAVAFALLALGPLAAGCAGRHRGPRSLAALGAVLVGGGGATWISGERSDQRATATAGFAIVALGLVAVIASGGWMANDIACSADPDCDEAEQCREVPAPPGWDPVQAVRAALTSG